MRRLKRLRLLAGLVVIGILAAACSTPPYEPLTADTDLTDAYVLAFRVACGVDCETGKRVYLSANVEDPEVIEAMAGAVRATVAVVTSPIESRQDLAAEDVAIAYTVEQAILVDGNVAIIRVGRSEVTAGHSTYRGADYQLSFRLDGTWVVRPPEDTGITVTTSVS